jgi:hypothetical protein
LLRCSTPHNDEKENVFLGCRAVSGLQKRKRGTMCPHGRGNNGMYGLLHLYQLAVAMMEEGVYALLIAWL